MRAAASPAGVGRDRPAAAGQHCARLHHRRHHRAPCRRRPAACDRAAGSRAPSARPNSIGYTLYYATNFIFTGLAVSVAFHGGLFNIGGEGQAYLGGLGCGLAVLALDRYLPIWLMIPVGIVAAALFGAAWAAVPAWLQAWRGSHIVITTIMFNFVAAALMVYLMVNVLIAPGSMTPQSRNFAPSRLHAGQMARQTRSTSRWRWRSPAASRVWVFLWHTPWGYALRTMGHNPEAAVYAGTDLRRMTMLAMCLSAARWPAWSASTS